MSLLENIHSPDDLRKLKESDLRALAKEIRATILSTVTKNGGHLASNLGVIELTIALHRVFESPKDAIVWDVGHQCYTHKLLTGRADLFSRIRQKDGLSGFPKRSESPHDIFETGHSSTSISSALGLLAAWHRRGQPGRVVAVIGDGALTAGLAYEALSNVAPLGLPLIVILNDNKMSISKNVGALSRYLSRLAASLKYQTFRRRVDGLVGTIPYFGPYLTDLIVRSKRAVKAVFFKNNFFSDLGFEYVGPIDGHNIPMLTSVFQQARRLERPVVIHIVTRKGKGYDKAEVDPEAFHGVSPFCPDVQVSRPSFTELFGRSILDIASERGNIVAITAAMAKGTGLEAMANKFPTRVYDVGIAEQHAVAFAAGLATGGLKPIVALYSTFFQRAVDQVLHDVALPNLDVVFALDRAGAVGEDGETHQGLYDIPLLRSMPNMSILAPSSPSELDVFLRAAFNHGGPVALRYPKAKAECDEEYCLEPLVWGRGVQARRRPKARILVCALGPLVPIASSASDRLETLDISVDVYSFRFAAPIDEDYIAALCSGYSEIVVIEDGSKIGGVGEALASILSRRSIGVGLSLLGFAARPLAQASRGELLTEAGLDEASLYAILKAKAEPAGARSDYETVPIAAS
ncbi:MAG: 1-deoxy-D-xylulose-5-phosphate synthase [Spirochaetes bacterium]|nr:1-deoxy-D-xylulose-5-phosphate synthase [Spirochaetota bacterium]